MAEKVFTTIEEQIEILKNRGLSIEDENYAKAFLTRVNYYRLSGYWLTLKDHDQFYENVCFQNVVDIYMTDYEMRHIMLKYLETIETQFKSIYSYEFAEKYGKLGYQDSKNFTDFDQYLKILSKADEQKEKRKEQEAFLKHYIEDRKEDLPIWIYIDLLTIANISILYSISLPELQKNIADKYGFTMREGADIISSHLHNMTTLRNLCAHGSRIFNRLFIRKPFLNKKDRSKLLLDKYGHVDNAHLFGFILVMRQLLSEENFSALRNDLLSLFNKFPFVKIEHYGFPDNWDSLI